MVRPYAAKGRKKLKKRPRAEEEEEQQQEENDEVVSEQENEETLENEEREESTAEDERKAEEAIDEMPGIPIAPRVQDSKKKPGVIFVLERACLEFAKVGKVRKLISFAISSKFTADSRVLAVGLRHWIHQLDANLRNLYSRDMQISWASNLRSVKV